MDHFFKLGIDLFYSSGSANATSASDTFPLKYPPPPAAITTNCLPVFLPMYVIGVACALASRVAAHSCSPVFASNPRKRSSIVAPINTTPPAVTIEPPRFGVPVVVFSSSTTPSGTFQAISPLFTSTALSAPQGGFWFHRSNRSQLICVDKQIAGTSIKRSAGPVCSPQCAGYY